MRITKQLVATLIVAAVPFFGCSYKLQMALFNDTDSVVTIHLENRVITVGPRQLNGSTTLQPGRNGGCTFQPRRAMLPTQFQRRWNIILGRKGLTVLLKYSSSATLFCTYSRQVLRL